MYAEFRPRRLGHVNLYVSDLDRSMGFYEKVCGLEPVALEPGIRAGFHSNGNTHHDIGLLETSRGADRVGRDGKVQIAASRGTKPGLNHIGWEMEDEAAVVAAFKRLKSSPASVAFQRSVDHTIARSVYVADPDGNMHEFYADSIDDWRKIMNLQNRDLLTSGWDPLAAPPSTVARYTRKPIIRRVDGADLAPLRVTGVCLATRRYDEMLEFFRRTVGIEAGSEDRSPEGLRQAHFSAPHGERDLLLQEVGDHDAIGLRRFYLPLDRSMTIDQACTNLAARGIQFERVASPGQPAIRLSDPDGFAIEFYETH